MDAVGARRSGDASPGHASLTRLTRLFQADLQPPWKANYDWLLAQTASPFQLPWKANYDWLLAQTASPFFFTAATSLEACGACPGAAYSLCRWFGCRDLLKTKGKLGRRDLLREGERGQESS